MENVQKWQYECIAKNIVEVLQNKKYDSVYAENIAAARQAVLDKIPKRSSITLGGSMTVSALDLYDTFKSSDYRLYDRYDPALTLAQDFEVRRQGMLADYLVTGTNAITENGQLVNVDCCGNRVAGIVFGPKNVIVVTGVNKVVENLEEALKRLKKIAPMNAKRLGHDVPCACTSRCNEEACNTHARMCNYISIVDNGGEIPGRFTIIVIPETIGL